MDFNEPCFGRFSEDDSSSLIEHKVAALWTQYALLVTSGKDPTLFSAKVERLRDYDIELYELAHLQQVMARMEVEYACVEAATRKMELKAGMRHSMTSPTSMSYCPYTRQNAAATIEWLQTHYEEQSGISLPRGAMFGHYLDYCRQVALDPVNQASFGKIIRNVFPNVKTRRLGTRGQSKYHYYGMAIKDSSPYKEIMMSAQRVNNFFGEPSGKGMYSRTVAQTSLPRTPPGGSDPLQGAVLLQDFPGASNIHFRDNIRDTVAVFLMMYRHHCQRIIDTILRANLPDVKEFVVHFWQSLPNHIHTILRDDLVVRTVTLCDQVLYQAVTTLLIPGPLHALPNNLMTAIRGFGRDLVTWLSDTLKSQPAQLRVKKLQVARRFSQRLWRLTAVSHMASIARSFLHSHDVRTKLPNDWATLDIDVINKEVSRDLELSTVERSDLQQYVEEFSQLINQHMTLDQYIDWVKGVFSKTTRRVKSSSGGDLQSAARVVLLQWVYVTKVFIRELTLLSADMFGPYHLMSLLSQDYVLYLAEDWRRQEAEHILRLSILGGEEKEFVPDWDKLLSPQKEPNLNVSPTDSFQMTPEKGYNSQIETFNYLAYQETPTLPIRPAVQPPKREVNYASMLGLQKAERCEFLRCQDDILQQDRAFDKVEQTPPDDVGTRALDLSVSYNSSFTEDDALVDKVISKGYATLDDCSQTISPLPWKSEANHLQSVSPSVHHQTTALEHSQTMTRATSTMTSAAVYHQLPQEISTIKQVNMRDMSRPVIRQDSDHYERSITVNYNNHNNSSHQQTNHGQPPMTFTPKGNYNLYPSSQYLDLTYSQREHQSASPVLKAGVQQVVNTNRSPYNFSLPDFTHISGSLQVTPLSTRKKWILEEEMRNGLTPSKPMQHMPSTHI